MFTGILLTGLGSAWYHSAPDNDRLVYDRIPMTLVFMSLLAATVAEFINRKVGTGLFIPSYPMLAIPLIMILYYDPSSISD